MDWSPGGSRPLVSRRFLGAWLVLVATLPLGVRSYYRNSRIGVTTWEPGSRMGINYRTYHYAAEQARAGNSFYDVSPPDTFDWAAYLYPPGTVPVYYPFTLADWETGYAILVGLSVLSAAVATWFVVDYVEHLGPTLGWLDIGLILAAFLLSTHAFGTIYFGNINLFLALWLVAGFWALQRGRDGAAGVLFGITALFKLFPALVGLWLLRLRKWRAIAAAVATGVSGLVGGVLLFGLETTRYYLTEVVTGRTNTDQFVGGYPVDGTYYVTIQQPLSHYLWELWPTAPYEALVALSVAVCLPVLAYFYRDLATELDQQMAIFVTLVVMVVILPSLRWYLVLLYLPLITLLYTWERGRARLVFVLGGVLFSVTYSAGEATSLFADAPGVLSTVWVNVAGAAVPPLYGLVLMVAACAWHKRRTRSAE